MPTSTNSCAEPKIEPRSPAGKLDFHVFAALAEFERNLIRECTVAGLKAARARGRKGGHPAKLSAKEIKTIREIRVEFDVMGGKLLKHGSGS